MKDRQLKQRQKEKLKSRRTTETEDRTKNKGTEGEKVYSKNIFKATDGC